MSQTLWGVQEKRKESEIVLVPKELTAQKGKLPIKIQLRSAHATQILLRSGVTNGACVWVCWGMEGTTQHMFILQGTRLPWHYCLVQKLSFMVSFFCSNTQDNKNVLPGKQSLQRHPSQNSPLLLTN